MQPFHHVSKEMCTQFKNRMPPMGSRIFVAPAVKGAACVGGRSLINAAKTKPPNLRIKNPLPSQIWGSKTEYHWLMDIKFNLKDIIIPLRYTTIHSLTFKLVDNFIKVAIFGEEEKI